MRTERAHENILDRVRHWLAQPWLAEVAWRSFRAGREVERKQMTGEMTPVPTVPPVSRPAYYSPGMFARAYYRRHVQPTRVPPVVRVTAVAPYSATAEPSAFTQLLAPREDAWLNSPGPARATLFNVTPQDCEPNTDDAETFKARSLLQLRYCEHKKASEA